MQYSFRLAELLGHVPDPRKRPGTIKAIVEHTGLDRHQVAALLRNEVKYIPLKALSRLCDFLVQHGYVPADRLPGALFAVEPEHFWELLARRERLELCLGVRQAEDDAWPAWVVAADSLLLGEVLNGVSTLGGSAKHRQEENGDPEELLEPPQPEHLRQSLVWSPGQADETEVISRAKQVYEDFSLQGNNKALVCLGSTKSNPVVELIVSGAFGCEPFRCEDGTARADERTCPFYLRYRDNDPHPASCLGGTSLAADIPSGPPGIYYENAQGSWECCISDSKEHDAALVFYLHRESQGRLEMALCGFSGRATRLLARTLARRAEDFWPPVYEGHGIQVGAYVIQFKVGDQDEYPHDILRTDLRASTKVIPLDEQAIARRVNARTR